MGGQKARREWLRREEGTTTRDVDHRRMHTRVGATTPADPALDRQRARQKKYTNVNGQDNRKGGTTGSVRSDGGGARPVTEIDDLNK